LKTFKSVNIGASPSIGFNQGLTPIPLETVVERPRIGIDIVETLERLSEVFAGAQLTYNVGRITGVKSGQVEIGGLGQFARIGDRLRISPKDGLPLFAEVLQIRNDVVCGLPEKAPSGVALGDRVTLLPPPKFAPSDQWIGRVIDPFGRPLDGAPISPGPKVVDVMAAPPPATGRQSMGGRLSTGFAVLNTLLPIAEGQRIGLFAGSGVGKSRLTAKLTRNMEADVVILALIGERGREVNDFVTSVLGPEGMARTVVVAATSDQSALTRRRCAWSAMSVAEHFRDQGKSVLFFADSITRFAEAHREVAAAGGEAPALRGFPPSVATTITSLCERSGPGLKGSGSITAIYSVLVAGSDMDEPIADILRGVLDGHIVLSRDIAERGRFPAIDVARSVSRSLPDAATEEENDLLLQARRLLGAYEQSEVMIKAGLYAAGSDPILDQAVRAWPDLDAFFAKEEQPDIAGSFDRLKLILRRSEVGRD
jgi:flagellum-specific ATP synthase